MSAPFDRPCDGAGAGGCSCDWCGVVFIGAEHHDGCCAVCLAAEPWKLLPSFDFVAARERLAAVIAAQDAERGRPLTDAERLENLFRGLNEGEPTRLPTTPREEA